MENSKSLQAVWNRIPFNVKYYSSISVVPFVLWKLFANVFIKTPLRNFFIKRGLFFGSMSGLSVFGIQYNIKTKRGMRVTFEVEKISLRINIIGTFTNLCFHAKQFFTKRNSIKLGQDDIKDNTSFSSQEHQKDTKNSDSKIDKLEEKNNHLDLKKSDTRDRIPNNAKISNKLFQLKISKPRILIFIEEGMQDAIKESDHETINTNKNKSNPEKDISNMYKSDNIEDKIKSFGGRVDKAISSIKKRLIFFTNILTLFFPLGEIIVDDLVINIAKSQESWHLDHGLSLSILRIHTGSERTSKGSTKLSETLYLAALWIKNKIFKKRKKKVDNKNPNFLLNNTKNADKSTKKFDSNSLNEKNPEQMRNSVGSKKSMGYYNNIIFSFSNINLFTPSDNLLSAKNKSKTPESVLKGYDFEIKILPSKHKISEFSSAEIPGMSELNIQIESNFWGAPQKAKIGLNVGPVHSNSTGVVKIASEFAHFLSEYESATTLPEIIEVYLRELRYELNKNIPKESENNPMERSFEFGEDFLKLRAKGFKKLLKSISKYEDIIKSKKLILYYAGYLTQKLSLYGVTAETYIEKIIIKMDNNLSIGKLFKKSYNFNSLTICQKDILLRSNYKFTRQKILLNNLKNSKNAETNSKSEIPIDPDVHTQNSINISKSDTEQKLKNEEPHLNTNITNTEFEETITSKSPENIGDVFENSKMKQLSDENIKYGEILLTSDVQFKPLNFEAEFEVGFRLGEFDIYCQNRNIDNENSYNPSEIHNNTTKKSIGFSSAEFFLIVPVGFKTNEDLFFRLKPQFKGVIENPKVLLNLELLIALESSIKYFKLIKRLIIFEKLKTRQIKNNDLVENQSDSSIHSRNSIFKNEINDVEAIEKVWNQQKKQTGKWAQIAAWSKVVLEKILVRIEVNDILISISPSEYNDVPLEKNNPHQDLLIFIKNAYLESKWTLSKSENMYSTAASVKATVDVKSEISPLNVVLQAPCSNLVDQFKKIYKNEVPLVGSNGFQATGSIDLLLGYPNRFYHGERPYVNSSFAFNFGVINSTILGNEFIDLLRWYPVWNAVLKLSSLAEDSGYPGSEFYNPLINELAKNVFGLNDMGLDINQSLNQKQNPNQSSTGENELKNSFFGAFQKIDKDSGSKLDEIPRTDFKTKISAILSEFRISIALDDGEADSKLGLLHGFSFFIRNASIESNLTKQKLEKNSETTINVGQVSLKTFNCLKRKSGSDTNPNTKYDNRKNAINYEKSFNILGWELLNRERVIFIEKIKLDLPQTKSGNELDSKKNIDCSVEILQTSLSSTSIYRIFLFMQRLAVISALASNNSDIEKQKNEVVPILKKKVLTNMKLQILSSEVSLLLPNCDFHDIKRNLLEQKEPKMDNIELIFKIPDIKADLELNNYSSNFSKVIKLTAPYIGILGINGFKEPIYTCTNAIVKVEIPWVSSVLEVNGMPSTKIAKPDIS
ncbi:hypothetical protein BB559_003929, partial [Furculomyces boomerangus]